MRRALREDKEKWQLVAQSLVSLGNLLSEIGDSKPAGGVAAQQDLEQNPALACGGGRAEGEGRRKGGNEEGRGRRAGAAPCSPRRSCTTTRLEVAEDATCSNAQPPSLSLTTDPDPRQTQKPVPSPDPNPDLNPDPNTDPNPDPNPNPNYPGPHPSPNPS